MTALLEMDELQKQRLKLVEVLNEAASIEGTYQSALSRVELTRLSEPSPRRPCVYRPGILLIGQGRKRGYVGNRVLPYDPDHYLVLSAPMAFECDYDCSPDEPLLAAMIDLDPAVIAELLLEMDEPPPTVTEPPPAIYSAALDERMIGAVIRLLQCLKSPQDCRVLAPQIIREIVYIALTSEHGAQLKALAGSDQQFYRITSVLGLIHRNPEKEFTTELLAKKAGMGLSTFHHIFKQVAGVSPIQYVKHIRLDRARWLMANEGLTAGVAATQVGYASASQFSREFKRMFGATPVEEADKLRSNFTLNR